MLRRFLAAAIAASAAVAFLNARAEAQYDNTQPLPLAAQLQTLLRIELKGGEVERVAPDAISLKCDGKSFLMHVDPTMAKVQCNGTADAGFLKPGVMVRFEADLDKKWQSKFLLEELTVVTPSETSQPGIHYDAPAGDNPGRGKKPAASDTYVVVGTIKLFKDNQLQVVADGKTVKADVAKDAKITVEIDDFTLAAAGDEINLAARQIQPPNGQAPGQLYAEEVTITLAKPLSSSTKVPSKAKKGAKGKKAAR